MIILNTTRGAVESRVLATSTPETESLYIYLHFLSLDIIPEVSHQKCRRSRIVTSWFQVLHR